MIPMRRVPDETPADATNVLVPGMFGLGFLISLGVLVGDFVGRLLPASGKKRRAEVVRHARGRLSDIAAVADGAAPEPGVIARVARGRLLSFGLGAAAGMVAAASVIGGFAVAARVGVDRQGWAIGAGLVIAGPVAALGLTWLVSATLGRRAPRWLEYVNSFWPFGTYPELQTVEEG